MISGLPCNVVAKSLDQLQDMHTEFIPLILSGFERLGSFSPSTKASILRIFRLFLVKAYSNIGINDKHKKKCYPEAGRV